MKKSRKSAVVLLVAITVFAAASLSEVGVSYGASGGFCAEDIAKFCPDRQSGKGAVPACLREYESELSPACKDSLAKWQGRKTDRGGICRADAEKFCKNVEPGGKRIAACLMEHKAELSPECGDHLSKMSQRPSPRSSVQ